MSEFIIKKEQRQSLHALLSIKYADHPKILENEELERQLSFCYSTMEEADVVIVQNSISKKYGVNFD